MWALFTGDGRFYVTTHEEEAAAWQEDGKLAGPVVMATDASGVPLSDIVGRYGHAWMVRDDWQL